MLHINFYYKRGHKYLRIKGSEGFTTKLIIDDTHGI